MMTSLFDLAGQTLLEKPINLPIDLLQSGGRRVFPLEFFAVDEGPSRKTGAVPVVEESGSHLAVLEQAAAETRAMIDRERQAAVDELRHQLALDLESRLSAERVRVDLVCAQFARDRQRYFAAAETQVVKLALAVAKRVLNREVSGEGLHLADTVSAALAKVHDGSSVVLRVNPLETALWRDLFANEGESRVEVVEDDRVAGGDCVLETDVGRVELGVHAQLDEIERGFNELMQRQSQ